MGGDSSKQTHQYGPDILQAFESKDTTRLMQYLQREAIAHDDVAFLQSLLMLAVEKNDDDFVEYLLRLGVDPNLINADGTTVLILAIVQNNPLIVDLLLSNGADPNKTNDEGIPPLTLAYDANQTQIIEVLKLYDAVEYPPPEIDNNFPDVLLKIMNHVNKLAHHDLIALAKKYFGSNAESLSEGICFGFSSKFIDAVLQNDEKVFFKRLKIIEYYKDKGSELELLIQYFLNQNKKEELKSELDIELVIQNYHELVRTYGEINPEAPITETDILEIPAFFESLITYFAPDDLPELYNEALDEQSYRVSHQYGRSLHQEQLNQEPFILPNRSLCLSQQDLEEYLDSLQKILLEGQNTKVAINFCANNHSIVIVFDKDKGYQLLDINHLSETEQGFERYLTASELATTIIKETPIPKGIPRDNKLLFDCQLISAEPDLSLNEKLTSLSDSFYTRNDFNYVDPSGSTLFKYIIHFSDVDLLKKVLTLKDVDINKVDFDGDSFLLKTIETGRNKLLAELVKTNIDLNKTGNDQLTPLMLAVKSNNLEAVNLLLSNGSVNIEIYGSNKLRALDSAVIYGQTEILQQLIKAGAQIQRERNPQPLHIALMYGQLEAAKIIIENSSQQALSALEEIPRAKLKSTTLLNDSKKFANFIIDIPPDKLKFTCNIIKLYLKDSFKLSTLDLTEIAQHLNEAQFENLSDILIEQQVTSPIKLLKSFIDSPLQLTTLIKILPKEFLIEKLNLKNSAGNSILSFALDKPELQPYITRLFPIHAKANNSAILIEPIKRFYQLLESTNLSTNEQHEKAALEKYLTAQNLSPDDIEFIGSQKYGEDFTTHLQTLSMPLDESYKEKSQKPLTEAETHVKYKAALSELRDNHNSEEQAGLAHNNTP